MPDSANDFYHQKTDAELQFFVDNPTYYQPALVESARQELRRRVAAAPPAPPVAPVAPSEPAPVAPRDPAAPVTPTSAAAPVASAPPVMMPFMERPAAYVAPELPEPTSRRTLLLVGVAILLVLGIGTYYLKQRSDASTAALQAQAEARRHLPPPTLTEVKTSAIPNYVGPAAAAAAEQLRQLPAGEKANAQHMRQFRELLKRFWAAETQSEYLVNQAYAGQAGSNFADQALVARETWRAWNHAYVYTYDFGPVMKAQLERMGETASNQQHILDTLPDLLDGNKFREDNEMQNRTADVEDLVGGLVRVSPVSGQAYKRRLLRAK